MLIYYSKKICIALSQTSIFGNNVTKTHITQLLQNIAHHIVSTYQRSANTHLTSFWKSKGRYCGCKIMPEYRHRQFLVLQIVKSTCNSQTWVKCRQYFSINWLRQQMALRDLLSLLFDVSLSMPRSEGIIHKTSCNTLVHLNDVWEHKRRPSLTPATHCWWSGGLQRDAVGG